MVDLIKLMLKFEYQLLNITYTKRVIKSISLSFYLIKQLISIKIKQFSRTILISNNQIPSLNWKLVPKIRNDGQLHITIFLCYSWCKSRTIHSLHMILHRFPKSKRSLMLFLQYFLPHLARIFNNHMCVCTFLVSEIVLNRVYKRADAIVWQYNFGSFLCCSAYSIDDPEIDVHLWLFHNAMRAYFRLKFSANEQSLNRSNFNTNIIISSIPNIL